MIYYFIFKNEKFKKENVSLQTYASTPYFSEKKNSKNQTKKKRSLFM